MPPVSVFASGRWLLLACLMLTQLASGQRLTRYVTDQTGILTETELAMLEAKLSDFDKATSTQVVVFIVPTIESGSIEEASLRVAEENGIGRKGRNNGALLFIAKNDRKIRIEVGYGLEGVLTDVISGLIIRQEIAPRFRQGQFFEGIGAGVDAILAATKNEYVAEPSGNKSPGLGVLPIVLIILIFFFINAGTRRRRLLGGGVPPIFFPGSGGRGSGGFGGGGGFSGGGGSFGGGGSSGSW